MYIHKTFDPISKLKFCLTLIHALHWFNFWIMVDQTGQIRQKMSQGRICECLDQSQQRQGVFHDQEKPLIFPCDEELKV